MPNGPPPAADRGSGEGLRARKKRLTRQLISDTATALFFERGFDAVRVADVADACGVSEKTVFNYFPTKESLLLDREAGIGEALRRALGPGAPDGSPVDAVVAEIEADLAGWVGEIPTDLDARALDGIRRFAELVQGSPSLRAAQHDMTSRLALVAAVALAERAGVDPSDPEPQIAATAIVGLWRIQFHALGRHASGTGSTRELVDAVVADVRRAARLVDGGLWSFAAVLDGTTTRGQLDAAADRARSGATHVVAAMRSARAEHARV